MWYREKQKKPVYWMPKEREALSTAYKRSSRLKTEKSGRYERAWSDGAREGYRHQGPNAQNVFYPQAQTTAKGV